DWNGSLGDKFVKEAVFLVLNIIPVYGVCTFVDAIVLNLVEFWTGSNPMAIKQGHNQINENLAVDVNGNNAVIKDANGKELATMSFNEADNTWYANINGHVVKVMTVNTNDVSIYTTSGKVLNVTKSDVNKASTYYLVNEYSAMK
ncbi:MAG TPA: DUF3332 family protein, partial [Bacteroidales bacterium]